MPPEQGHPPTHPTAPPQAPIDTSARDAYNVVSDTVIGVNLRWRDNLYQGLVILACLVIGAVVGFAIASPPDRIGYLIVGGIIGMIIGLFGSGLFLMIFRAARHMRGKHD